MRTLIAKFYRLLGKMESRKKYRKCWKNHAKKGQIYDATGLCIGWDLSILFDRGCKNCPYNGKKEDKE